MISQYIFKGVAKVGEKKTRGGKREGAGRKPANPEEGSVITIAVSVPSGLVDQLDAHAGANNLSRSGAVTKAIRGLLGTRKRSAKD
jgi:hypothetical protein